MQYVHGLEGIADERRELGQRRRAVGAATGTARSRAAFIGLAIASRGEWDGEEVIVDLDVVQIAASVRAVR